MVSAEMKAAIMASNLPAVVKTALMRKRAKSPPNTIHVGNVLVVIGAVTKIAPTNAPFLLESPFGALRNMPGEMIATLTAEDGMEAGFWALMVLLIGLAVMSGVRKATGYKLGIWFGNWGVAL